MDFEPFASPNWLSTTLSASSRSRKPPTNFIDEAKKMVDSKYAGSDNGVSLLLISCYWKCFPNDQVSGVREFGACLIDFAMYSGCHNAPQIDYFFLRDTTDRLADDCRKHARNHKKGGQHRLRALAEHITGKQRYVNRIVVRSNYTPKRQVGFFDLVL